MHPGVALDAPYPMQRIGFLITLRQSVDQALLSFDAEEEAPIHIEKVILVVNRISNVAR